MLTGLKAPTNYLILFTYLFTLLSKDFSIPGVAPFSVRMCSLFRTFYHSQSKDVSFPRVVYITVERWFCSLCCLLYCPKMFLLLFVLLLKFVYFWLLLSSLSKEFYSVSMFNTYCLLVYFDYCHAHLHFFFLTDV